MARVAFPSASAEHRFKEEETDSDSTSSTHRTRKIRRRSRRPPPAPTTSTTSTMLMYILYVLRLLRKPFTLALLAAVVYTLVAAASHSLLTSICSYPLASFFPIPICPAPSSSSKGIKYADYPSLISIQSSAFESLPLSSTSTLSLSIKKLELASADLKVVVQGSTLKNKDTLGDALGRFQEDAKVTARGLQKFGAMTSGALNQIEAVNAHALSLISESPSSSQENGYSILPWKRRTHDDIVLDSFIMTMNTLSTELARLILFAQAELEHLDKLEQDSELLHTLLSFSSTPSSIVTMDSLEKSAVQQFIDPLSNVVKRIWKGHKLYTEDMLLSNLDLYRARAKLHIVTALTTLEGFLDELEDLRERVSTPGLAGITPGGANVPVEVSMKSIQSGLDQLKKSRVRAREEDGRLVLGSAL